MAALPEKSGPAPAPQPVPQRSGPQLRPVPPTENAPAPDPPVEGVVAESAAPPVPVWRRAASRLRPPDVWATPAPTLKDEVARAMEGAHLPEHPVIRGAETVRAVVSSGVIALLLMLIHINRSAGRQAVALLVVATALGVVATLTG